MEKRFNLSTREQQGKHMEAIQRLADEKQDLLEKNHELMRLLEIHAKMLYRTSCPTPELSRRVWDYMRAESFQEGDLVMEVTSFGNRALDGCRIGRFVREAYEQILDPDIDYSEVPEDEMPQPEQVFYIKLLSGIEFRWFNARLVRLFDRMLQG